MMFWNKPKEKESTVESELVKATKERRLMWEVQRNHASTVYLAELPNGVHLNAHQSISAPHLFYAGDREYPYGKRDRFLTSTELYRAVELQILGYRYPASYKVDEGLEGLNSED